MTNPQVLVLGMHRSGTSLVARALEAAGLYAGRSDDMLAAQADNPLGFYERQDLLEANDALLKTAGASWFQPPEAPLGGDGPAMAAVAAVNETLASSAGADVGTFLKDPRLCLTWPAWAGSDTVILYVYRNPLAVADSLRRRNAFPLIMDSRSGSTTIAARSGRSWTGLTSASPTTPSPSIPQRSSAC